MKYKEISISPNGNTFTFMLEDGTVIVKKFNFEIPEFYNPDASIIFALTAALNETIDRVADLERLIKD